MINRISLEKDAKDLFSRRKGGHVEGWLYVDATPEGMTGSDLWRAFLKASQNYYILPNEIALIKSVAQSLSPRLDIYDTVLDFGAGSEDAITNKALPFIRAAGNSQLYVPVDLSQEYLNDAQNIIAQRTNTIVKPVHGDFFNDNLSLPGKNRLSMIFGATISNMNIMEGEGFPRQGIIKKIQHLRGLLDNGHSNLLLASFDANADKASILKAYDNIHWKRFITNLAYSMDKMLDIKGCFRPSAWHYEPVWNDKAKVLHHMITASENQDFAIDDISFKVKKGERFVAINSFKFPVAWFQSMAKEAGFHLEQNFVDKQNRMVIQSLRV